MYCLTLKEVSRFESFISEMETENVLLNYCYLLLIFFSLLNVELKISIQVSNCRIQLTNRLHFSIYFSISQQRPIAKMPRCYFFNLVETPTFVTTDFFPKGFARIQSLAILRKMTMDFVCSHFSWQPFSSICARVHVHKLTSAARLFHLLTKSEKSKSQKSGF